MHFPIEVTWTGERALEATASTWYRLAPLCTL